MVRAARDIDQMGRQTMSSVLRPSLPIAELLAAVSQAEWDFTGPGLNVGALLTNFY